jgi:TM2 domain-containing membrane protein YozV
MAHCSARSRVNGEGTVNLSTAYLLYFTGGIFGLHHAYLNRPEQAILWYTTWGLFGIGLLRDLINVPYYVSLCRDDRTNDVAARARAATVEAMEYIPQFSLARIILMGFFGSYFGSLASCLVALPRKEDSIVVGSDLWWTDMVYGLLRVLGCAVGIWLVGNMGEEMIAKTQPKIQNGNILSDRNKKCGFLDLATWCMGSLMVLRSPVLGGIVCAVKRRRYKSTMRPEQSASKRIARHLLQCVVFTAVIMLAAYNHGSILVNGDRVYLGDALKNAYHSNFWKEFDWEQFNQQRQSSGGGGEYLKNTFDISGERAARRTLGVARDATHAEVRSAYKKLALKYHPDKIGSDATVKEVEKANQQFNNVQEAYDVLNNIEQARKKRERGREEDGRSSSSYREEM